MSSARPERVQEAIRQEVSRIVQTEMRDPRLGFLTITAVELTRDLRFARIFFSVMGEEKDKKLALKGLNSAKGFIKGLLSDRIKLKFMPDIEFKIDESIEHTRKISDILDQIKKEKRNAEGDRGDQEA
jgi:ribosome-binding factor A